MSRPSKRVAIASGDEPSNHESRHGVCARLDNSLLDEESGNEEDLPEIADTLGSALLEAFARGEGQFPVHSGKRRKKDLDPGIDYLINASERSGVECRRKVFDTCFDNAAAESDHLECNNGDVLGCRRCNVVAPATCCDIHNPSAFSSFESHLPKPPRMSQRSRLPKYTKDKYDYKLEEALLDWREDKTVAVYGWACLNDHGPVIMTATTLNRVVDCAHHHKIQTREDLKRETAWMNSDQYGDEIVNLIKQHAAPATSLLVSTPLRIRGMALGGDQTAGPSTSPHLTPPSSSLRFTTVFSASGESSNIPSKRRSRCSACGQEGHNARNRVCPKHPSHVSTGDKENVSQLTRSCV
ncbi:hypothetical protein PISMIDRAFT_120112 [Pisolithus microcarpus 441]|uniref:Unplaced genomic scaffold scaffold_357, whole genome shotgun sequence n=1 Tax=Pisolithus microcarpus 441 TaxID=765257 RepID=A0A0C9XKI5_9AGAM|nr:hypothetical protein PISMIDRAFT_120112 [Pisolithus microcarpus 441]